MFVKLEDEENCYVTRSIVQAIGKVSDLNDIERLLIWFSTNKNKFIEMKYYGIFKHMASAISRIDLTSDRKYYYKFYNQYSEYLSDYIF